MTNDDAASGESVEATYHGFYSSWEEDDLSHMNECTLFVTDESLIIGDMGEYEVAGGLPELLPDPLEGIVRSLLADDDPDTMDLETARKRPDTEELELSEIVEIETEQELPSQKQLVEIEDEYGFDTTIYIGSGASHGTQAETQEFVSALESAAKDAGGAPRVRTELEL